MSDKQQGVDQQTGRPKVDVTRTGCDALAL